MAGRAAFGIFAFELAARLRAMIWSSALKVTMRFLAYVSARLKIGTVQFAVRFGTLCGAMCTRSLHRATSLWTDDHTTGLVTF